MYEKLESVVYSRLIHQPQAFATNNTNMMYNNRTINNRTYIMPTKLFYPSTIVFCEQNNKYLRYWHKRCNTKKHETKQQ